MKKYLISCLEPSANLHFGEILKHLGKCHIFGIFDKDLGEPIFDSKEFSAMGFIEILPLILKAKKALKQMVELSKNCDAVLLIDSPAFNLPLAKKIRQSNIDTKIIYYILPQVWAWKRKRVSIVEQYCDTLASILPFDSQFYSKSKYVGHPLLDEIKEVKTTQINLKTPKAISFLPGSRKSEIQKLMPIFNEVAKNFNCKKILPVPKQLVNDMDCVYGDVSDFCVTTDTVKALLESDFAFICSGTATLQAALIGTPFVLCYKAKSIDMFIAKRFVKLKHAGLANIIFDFMGLDELHKELIQGDLTVENMIKAYNDCNYLKFSSSCNILRQYLKHGSAKNVANMLMQ